MSPQVQNFCHKLPWHRSVPFVACATLLWSRAMNHLGLAAMRRVATSQSLVMFLAFSMGVLGGLPTAQAVDPQGRAGEYYENAVKRYNAQDYDGAIIQLKNALQQDSKMISAMILMGEVYVAAGQGAAAETALKEAEKAGADHSLVVQPMGRALLLQFKGREFLAAPMPTDLPLLKRSALLELKAEAAMQVYDRVALINILNDIDRIDPNSITALSMRATLAMRDGTFDEAAKYVDQLAHLDEKSPLVWLTRASLSHVRDEFEQALLEYGKVIELEKDNTDARLARIGLLLDLGRDQEAQPDFAYFSADKKKASDPRLAYLLAVNLSRQGKEKEAQAQLTDAANTIEVLGKEIVNRNIQLLMVAGIVNFTQGKDEVARGYLEEYLKLSKGDIPIRKMLGAIFIKQREFGRAVKLLEQTVEQGGDTPEVLALLARAYSGTGNEARATAALQRAVVLSPNDTKLSTDLALSRAKRGETTNALTELSSVFTRDNFSVIAGMPLATLYLNHGKSAEAAAVSEKLLRAKPTDPMILNLHGIALVGLGKFDEARVVFEKALKNNSDFAAAEINLAKLDRREGKFADADKRLASLLGKKPNDAQLMVEMGRVAVAKGDHKGALKWARDAAQIDSKSFDIAKFLIEQLIRDHNFTDAYNVVLAQLQEHPDNLFVLEMQARVLAGQNKVDDLRSVLKKMVGLASFDIDWLKRIAAVQRAAGLLEDARYALLKATGAETHDRDAEAALAEVELALDHRDAAAELATKITKNFANDPVGFALLGDIALRNGDPAGAVTAYGKALAFTPENPALILKQHNALRGTKDNAAAEKILRDWLSKKPDALWAEGALAEHFLATGNYAKSKQYFAAYLAKKPDDSAVLNNVAWLHIKTKEYAKAKDFASKAYKLNPEDAGIGDTLGWALINLSELDDGLRYLREARARAAAVPEIHYHLAVALQRQGRTKEALVELNEALRSPRDFDGKADAQQLLGKL